MLHLSAVLKLFLPLYEARYGLSAQQRKVSGQLNRCRTGELGYVERTCQCGHTSHVALSCRDRHCPRCQGTATAQWIINQSAKLLPTEYYHMVFTIPDQLKVLFEYNEELLYGELFHSSSGTLKRFFANDPRLKVQPGFAGILHTWGDELQYHPHVHYIVSGGGLDRDGQWCGLDTSKSSYLFSVRALSKYFRGNLLGRIEALSVKGRLKVPSWLNVKDILREASRRDWVVFSQPSKCRAEKVIEYFGRYSHRVAVSEKRLSLDGDSVLLASKREPGKQYHVDGVEFLRRFFHHVLPHRFHKIRYYGWWNHSMGKVRAAFSAASKLSMQKLQALLLVIDGYVERHQQFGVCCPDCGCHFEYLILPRLDLIYPHSFDHG